MTLPQIFGGIGLPFNIPGAIGAAALGPIAGATGVGFQAGSIGPLPELSSLLPGGLNIPGQSFSNIPVINGRLALYALSIRGGGTGQPAFATYTFPISPANLSYAYTAMSSVYDVQADPQASSDPSSRGGVVRVIDQYGQAPPIITIEGTTGWQRHLSDQYQLTGIQSVLALQAALTQFADLQAQAAQVGKTAYTLEFYDYFLGQYWQVVPIGRQEFKQSDRRALYVNYGFQLACVQQVGAGTFSGIADFLLGLISPGVQSAVQSIGTSITGFLDGYAGNTPGGAALSGQLT